MVPAEKSVTFTLSQTKLPVTLKLLLLVLGTEYVTVLGTADAVTKPVVSTAKPSLLPSLTSNQSVSLGVFVKLACTVMLPENPVIFQAMVCRPPEKPR